MAVRRTEQLQALILEQLDRRAKAQIRGLHPDGVIGSLFLTSKGFTWGDAGYWPDPALALVVRDFDLARVVGGDWVASPFQICECRAILVRPAGGGPAYCIDSENEASIALEAWANEHLPAIVRKALRDLDQNVRDNLEAWNRLGLDYQPSLVI